MTPTVGVVIPIYYGRKYLRETLQSVFGQNFSGSLQVVGIEDGTPIDEASHNICHEFPMKYVPLARNQGVMACRRVGAEQLVDVDYLAFLDQDDVWYPNFLSELIPPLDNHPQLAFVACNARLTDQGQGRPLYRDRVPSLCLADLKVANQIVSPSQVLMRRSCWQDALWSENLHGGADDWLLWLALLAGGYDACYVPRVLLDYRIHAEGAHNDRPRMLQSERIVVDEWFLRLGFSRWDQRRFYGRAAFDGLIEGTRDRQWALVVQSLLQAIRDPMALWSAFRFRQRHKSKGIV